MLAIRQRSVKKELRNKGLAQWCVDRSEEAKDTWTKKNCLLGALRWQIIGVLLTAVPRSIRETFATSQTVGAPGKVGTLCDRGPTCARPW